MKYLFICVLLIGLKAIAQEPFNAVLTYKASIMQPDTNLVLRSWQVKVFTNDTLVRVETETETLGNQIYIRHMTLNKAYLLLSLDGKKFAIQTDLEKVQKSDTITKQYHFKKRRGTKKIQGFKCQKYEVIDRGQSSGYMCYFAKKLSNKYLEVYSDIPGLALEYYLPSQDGLIHYELVSVSKGIQSRDLFGIPSDYHKITFEEFINAYYSK